MEAALTPVEMKIGKRRRTLHQAQPTVSKFVVLPRKAALDQTLTDGAFRVLATIATFVNRAGFTYVGQARLAKELQVNRKTISSQMRRLRDRGYIKTVKRGFSNSHNNTTRIIYDETITDADAIAIAGNGQEDVDMMPPDEQKARIAQMLAGIIKPVNQPNQRRYKMPTGETEAVKRIKAGLKKPKKPVDKSVDNPVDNSKKVLEKDHTNYIKTIGISINVEDSKELLTVLEQVTFNEFVEYADQVMERRHAEGLPAPSLANFVESVLLAQQQYLENALERATSDDRGAG